MTTESPFSGEPKDTRERIMRATYSALVQYGYAGISIQRIADEADLSKSAFYNHYEDKDELLLTFLDFMLDRYEAEFAAAISGDPMDDLNTLLTNAITGTIPTSETVRDRPKPAAVGPVVELRAQAVSDESFRKRFTELDEMIVAGIAGTIQSGIENGRFRDVDPDRTAEVLLTLVMGAMVRRSTVEDLDTEQLRADVDRVLETVLYVDDA